MGNYAYSLLLQMPGLPDAGKDDRQLFDEVHSSVRVFAETEKNEQLKSNAESIQRAISRLRAALIPYLSTPLRSDNDDIVRSINDTIHDVLTQIGSSSTQANAAIASYRILESAQVHLHRQLVGVIKRLLKNGKAMLADAGIATGKNSGSVFLTRIAFEGFSNVTTFRDGIEKIQRDGTGNEVTVVRDSLCELLVMHGTDAAADCHTVILHFNAHEGEIEKLKNALPALIDKFGIKSIRMGKRSFFSGFGSAYQLEIIANLAKHPLGTLLLAVVHDDAELEDALTEQGSLIVLEKIV